MYGDSNKKELVMKTTCSWTLKLAYTIGLVLLGATLMRYTQTPARANVALVNNQLVNQIPFSDEEKVANTLLLHWPVTLPEVRAMFEKVDAGEFSFDITLQRLGYAPETEEYEDALGRLTNVEYYHVTLYDDEHSVTKQFYTNNAEGERILLGTVSVSVYPDMNKDDRNRTLGLLAQQMSQELQEK